MAHHQSVPPRNRTFAKQMRREMPDAEFRLWCELRNRSLGRLRFRRQHPIGPFIVDFFCANKKLIVEVDGEQHAFEPNRRADVERTRWPQLQGHLVVRFWTNEVMQDLNAVCEAILAASRGEWRNEPTSDG
jgi:very-short-patch-repair endonuclease